MEAPDYVGTPEDLEALAEVSLSQYEDFQETYIPLENKYIERSKARDSDRNRAGGNANAQISAAFSKADSNVRTSNLTRGVSSSSGRGVTGIADNAVSKGRALGAAISGGRRSVDDTAQARQVGLIALGRGQTSDVISNLSTAANQSVQNALAVENARVAQANGLWNAAGAATGAYLAYNRNGDPKTNTNNNGAVDGVVTGAYLPNDTYASGSQYPGL